MQLADAGWRIYHLEGRLIRIVRGLLPIAGAGAALDVIRAAGDAVSLALQVFDHEGVSDDPLASQRVAALLEQARLSDAVRILEPLETHSSEQREVTDLRMCVAELGDLAAFFGEEWPLELVAARKGLDVAKG